jgi:RHS repeat-associated protein
LIASCFAVAFVLAVSLGGAGKSLAAPVGGQCEPDWPPSNTVPPAISPLGVRTGETLTTDNGQWLNDPLRNCFPPDYFRYQWKRNGAPISGQTSNTYVTSAADESADGSITVSVTVTGCHNDGGCTDANSSNGVSVTVPVSPLNGAMVATLTPTLTVSPQHVNTQLEHQFEVSKTPQFGADDLVYVSGWATLNTTISDPLADGTTYWWRAHVKDGAHISGWTDANSFTVLLPKLGSRDYWPMWSHGPLSVNEANGNLFFEAPTPSYPTATGAISFSLAYNSQDGDDQGLGQGWTLVAGEELANPPLDLVDLSGGGRPSSPDIYPDQIDAAEIDWNDGSSDLYDHVSGGTYQAPPGDGSKLTWSEDANGVRTWTLVDEDGSVYTFVLGSGSTYKLQSAQIVDSDGDRGQITYVFGSDPTKVTSITYKQTSSSPTGRTLTFNWSCTGALVCVTGPDGVTWRYIGTGGASGALARVNDGTRDLVAFTYNGDGKVATIKNANDLDPTHASPGYNGNHSLSIGYGASNRVASVSDGPVTGQSPSTSTWTLAYTYGGAATAATSQDHDGMPAGTVRQAFGYTTVTPPRQQGQPNPKSDKTYFDSFGHPMQVTDLLGNITKVQYSVKDQQLWTEDEDGNPTDYTYDPVDNILMSVKGPDPDGPGPLARPITSYRYDEQAIGTGGSAGPLLHGLQGHYFQNDQVIGKAAQRQNDATVNFAAGSGWLPSGFQSVRWIGDLVAPSDGQYTFVIESDAQSGTGSRLTLDGQPLIESWDSGGTQISADNELTAGKHTLVVDYRHTAGSTSAAITLKWSCWNCTPYLPEQVISTTNLLPTWLNQTSQVSPSGKVSFHHFATPQRGLVDYDLDKLADGTNVITSYEYDNLGRTTRKVIPKGNAGRTIDSNGNLGGTPNLSYATTYVYWDDGASSAPPASCGGGSVDQSGLLKSTTPYGIASTTSYYNLAGRAVATTSGAGTTCSNYDNEGRLTSDLAPGEQTAATYTYDPAGALRTATRGGGTVTSEYDEAGRLKRLVDSYGAQATYGYDSESNLLQRTAGLPTQLPFATTYTYDDADRLSTQVDPAGRHYSFFYDNHNALKATQYPNSTFSWTDYNPNGSVAAVYNHHGVLVPPLPPTVPSDRSPIVDYAYTYDIDGKQVNEVRTRGSLPAQSRSYAYDNLGRLSQATLPSGLRTYSFDLDSNRTAIVQNGQTIATYTYDPAHLDELSSVTQGGSTTNFQYTGDGQVNHRGSNTLTWDGRGRLSGGTFNASSITYGFDATGFRDLRTSGLQVRRYLLGGLFEQDGNNKIIDSDIDGPAGDLAHYSGAPTSSTTVSYLYYSGHGDLAAQADGTGAPTATYTYDPFGAPDDGVPANTTTERWTGRWNKKLDTATSLIEMGARPYDPNVGRFLSVDPIEGGALNNYDYAGQDPVNQYDLNGTCYRQFGPNGAMAAISYNWDTVGAHRALCLEVNMLFTVCYQQAWRANHNANDHDVKARCWKLVDKKLRRGHPHLWDPEPLGGGHIGSKDADRVCALWNAGKHALAITVAGSLAKGAAAIGALCAAWELWRAFS